MSPTENLIHLFHAFLTTLPAETQHRIVAVTEQACAMHTSSYDEFGQPDGSRLRNVWLRVVRIDRTAGLLLRAYEQELDETETQKRRSELYQFGGGLTADSREIRLRDQVEFSRANGDDQDVAEALERLAAC